MNDNLQDILISSIRQALQALYASSIAVAEVPVELTLSSGFGDLSNNVALRLAGMLKQRPLAVAGCIVQELKANFLQQKLAEYVEDIKAEGAGFINFYLKDSYFHGQLAAMLKKGQDWPRSDIGKGQKVLVEFVSANPTGPLSVAHARQAVVGDVLANVLLFQGFDVQREYYLNDEGNQITILGKSVEARLAQLEGTEVEFPENYYQGDYIRDIAAHIRDKKLSVGDFGEFTGGYILDIIKQELADFGVGFDCWYSQKSLRESGKIKEAFASLKDQGYLYEQDGALWFASTRFGDDKDRVVIKSDGSYTYLAPDIAYHKEKYARGFKWLINLWGPDHHGYIPRLKAAVQALGNSPESLSVVIVQLASIFRDGKAIEMSTRRGQYITLREVLDEVGRDAARFFFLMRRTSSHLNFDLDIAKKQTPENPVYYIQYAYARISSILANAGEDSQKKAFSADLSLLKESEERSLIKKLWEMPYILYVCYKTVDPYMMTAYLQEVAETFHKFYDRHRVLGQEEGLCAARVALLYATRSILSCGLQLLGISLPQKM